jgi:hypothetical protein
MIDQAREWLERLHASNAPEADMALDLLGRLREAEEYDAGTDALQQAHDDLEAKLAACEQAIFDTDGKWVPNGLEPDDPEHAIVALSDACNDLCEALGADGPEEAIAMARTLREAFE